MKKELINMASVRHDISELLADRFSEEETQWFARNYLREVLKGGHFENIPAPADAEDNVHYISYAPSAQLHADAAYILDWLAELHQRDPNLHSKLSRITFRQAHQHSRKWHAALAKAAEKSDRHVPEDKDNAPKMVDLGDGWAVYWLKTNEARDLEGEAMGNCVGSGRYDEIKPDEAVVSIRRNSVSHITLHLCPEEIIEAVTKANQDLPERYYWLMDAAWDAFKIRYQIQPGDLAKPLEDGLRKLPDGRSVHFKDGLPHRDDGPAVIYEDGREEYWVRGQLHREDGPAATQPDGYEAWYRDGELHREDGPAQTLSNGTRMWFRNGKEHRTGGPAVVKPDGSEVWYRDGVIHRDDGPAQSYADGEKQWYRNGFLHREDGPAIIAPDGYEAWYLNGEVFREDALEKAIEAGLFKTKSTTRAPSF